MPRNRYVLYVLLLALGLAADLATKQWIFAWLGMPGVQPTWWIWTGVFGFQTSLNEGALFGFGQGWVIAFSILSVAAAIGIACWLFVGKAARSLLLTFALGLITAGILGNLYDRLGLPGLIWNYTDSHHKIGEPVHAVRDWVLVMIYHWQWPNFNIADSLLVTGAILLVWHSYRANDSATSQSDPR